MVQSGQGARSSLNHKAKRGQTRFRDQAESHPITLCSLWLPRKHCELQQQRTVGRWTDWTPELSEVVAEWSRGCTPSIPLCLRRRTLDKHEPGDSHPRRTAGLDCIHKRFGLLCSALPTSISPGTSRSDPPWQPSLRTRESPFLRSCEALAAICISHYTVGGPREKPKGTRGL